MDYKIMRYPHNGILLSNKKENYVICKKMDGPGEHHAKWDQSDSENQESNIFLSYVEAIEKKGKKKDLRKIRVKTRE